SPVRQYLQLNSDRTEEHFFSLRLLKNLVRPHLKLLPLFIDGIPEGSIRLHQVIDSLNSMNDSTVVTTSEMIAYRLEGMVCKFLGKIHGHLSGSDNFLLPGFGLQILQFDTIIVRAGFLDKIN